MKCIWVIDSESPYQSLDIVIQSDGFFPFFKQKGKCFWCLIVKDVSMDPFKTVMVRNNESRLQMTIKIDTNGTGRYACSSLILRIGWKHSEYFRHTFQLTQKLHKKMITKNNQYLKYITNNNKRWTDRCNRLKCYAHRNCHDLCSKQHNLYTITKNSHNSQNIQINHSKFDSSIISNNRNWLRVMTTSQAYYICFFSDHAPFFSSAGIDQFLYLILSPKCCNQF